VLLLNKLQEFIAIINSKIGSGYVYGGQNPEPLTREALDKLVKKFGRSNYYFNGYSAERWLGKEYYDCSGLIVYTMRKMGLISNTEDYSAQGIYSKLCTPVAKDKLRAGDLCFNKTNSGIVHVGVYMGNNRVTHARGTFYGVVSTALFSSFNTMGRLNFFANETPDIIISAEKSIKKAIVEVNVLEEPIEIAAAIGKIKAGNPVYVDGKTDNGWYLVDIDGKKGYIKASALDDYDELKKAVTFLSERSGIDYAYWYKQAGTVKWLDVCLIKIAKGFGANLQ
jgi:cell wall-associated NlpC family hydrolase